MVWTDMTGMVSPIYTDVWDLKEGQDQYQFMEQIVNNPDVSKVLLVCNKQYVEKANQKRGGVGAESLIMSSGECSKKCVNFVDVDQIAA